MENIWQQLSDQIGNFKENYPLKSITTAGTGGLAKGAISVNNISTYLKIKNILTNAGVNNIVIGGGSNIIFSDDLFKGVVIINNIQGITNTDSIIKVRSGTKLQKLVDYTVNLGLDGIQKLTLIPGTVGGAVYGNAGAYGQTISDCITYVKVIRNNKIVKLKKQQCEFSYRNSIFKKNLDFIIEIGIKMKLTDKNTIWNEYQSINQIRKVKYPPTLKCPGSFFINVPCSNVKPEKLKFIPQNKIKDGKIHVGWLLESIDAIGLKTGGVEISKNHGNLMVNTGSATSSDFINLARSLSRKIYNKYGIILTPEVQLINFPSKK
jgi:UDP-N-acetylmuramate dehydrogenase